MKYLPLIFALSCAVMAPRIYSQEQCLPFHSHFINSLLYKRAQLAGCINPIEKYNEERLGISYDSVDCKFLIANDVTKDIADKVSSGSLIYSAKSEKLEDDFSLLRLSFNGIDLNREYYFKDTELVSKHYYWSRKWPVISTEFFEFHISDSSLTNPMAIAALEVFVRETAGLLNFSETDLTLLRNEKIIYYLCRDEEEIKRLTGFVTRGIYILASDCVISTYNCHFHELAHLLINFKLRHLKLYAHPLLQEGFAVAAGGRGGLAKDVVLSTGRFLCLSGFLSYLELLSNRAFLSQDASVTYPAAGLYVKFLIKNNGIQFLLDLYGEYSYNNGFTECTIDSVKLPANDKWQSFLTEEEALGKCAPAQNIPPNADLILEQNGDKIFKGQNGFFFLVKDTLLLRTDKKFSNYSSSLFNEYFKGRNYNSESLYITAAENEISVYDLFTNTLISKYAAGFSTTGEKPVKINGRYCFYLPTETISDHLK